MRSGLGDGGLNERKAVLHSFYHEFHDTQKLVSLEAPRPVLSGLWRGSSASYMHACLVCPHCAHKALQIVTCYACTTIISHALTRTAPAHWVGTLVCMQANLMADDFTMAEDGGSKTYSKQGE